MVAFVHSFIDYQALQNQKNPVAVLKEDLEFGVKETGI